METYNLSPEEIDQLQKIYDDFSNNLRQIEGRRHQKIKAILDKSDREKIGKILADIKK